MSLKNWIVLEFIRSFVEGCKARLWILFWIDFLVS